MHFHLVFVCVCQINGPLKKICSDIKWISWKRRCLNQHLGFFCIWLSSRGFIDLTFMLDRHELVTFLRQEWTQYTVFMFCVALSGERDPEVFRIQRQLYYSGLTWQYTCRLCWAKSTHSCQTGHTQLEDCLCLCLKGTVHPGIQNTYFSSYM